MKRNQGDGHEPQSCHGFLRQGLVERIHDLNTHPIELQALPLEATAIFPTNTISQIWQAQRIQPLFQACFGVSVSVPNGHSSVAYPSIFLNIIFKVILFLCSLPLFSSWGLLAVGHYLGEQQYESHMLLNRTGTNPARMRVHTGDLWTEDKSFTDNQQNDTT